MQPHKQHEIPSQQPYIPFVKITPSYICGYHQYQGPKRKTWQTNLFLSAEERKELLNEKRVKQAYTGEITQSSRKRLNQVCEILFAMAKRKTVVMAETGKRFSFRVNFITLTLSAPQDKFTDREIKELLLEPFLRIYRRKGMINYIWKAERQENGNIHFHIFSDCWVDKTELTNTWNRLQSKLGFIETFFKKYGHRHPPSTNVKAVKSEKGLQIYMLKYMLKKSDKGNQLELGRSTEAKDTGKIWDCAMHLKTKNNTAEPIENHEFELLQEAENFGSLRKVVTDHCTIYFPVGDKIWKVAPEFLANRIINFLAEIRRKGKEASKQKESEKSPPGISGR
jgi:hypothetical protein